MSRRVPVYGRAQLCRRAENLKESIGGELIARRTRKNKGGLSQVLKTRETPDVKKKEASK